MEVFSETVSVRTRGQGTYEFTGEVEAALRRSGLVEGVVHVFCRHTSCSLVVMENADASARRDLEAFLERLVPEGDPRYTHTLEGPDDATSHIKMALTRTSETVPVHGARLLLGTWQGLFLWEHRDAPHNRQLALVFIGKTV